MLSNRSFVQNKSKILLEPVPKINPPPPDDFVLPRLRTGFQQSN